MQGKLFLVILAATISQISSATNKTTNWLELARSTSDGISVASGVWLSNETAPVASKLRIENVAKNVRAVYAELVNTGMTAVVCKFMVETTADFIPTRYLIPGIMYNGNSYGSDKVPKGLTYKGEPWIFSYDRSTLPSCTVVENKDRVVGCFASDVDESSLVSASSVVKREDGRFSQRIYYPVTEAPVSYTNKKIYSPRYDTYLTLEPGKSFKTKSFIVDSRPRWENFGYGEIFKAAWPLLDHTVPRQLSNEEVWKYGMSFIRALRSIDDRGRATMDSCLQDASHALGNFQKKKQIPPELTLAAIDADRSKNFFLGTFPREGVLRRGGGSGIGFTGQCFMSARMMVTDAFRRQAPAAIAFGLDVFDNWIDNHQRANGLFKKPFAPDASVWARRTDGCHQGWAIIELVRLAQLLKANGMNGSRYIEAAEKCANFFMERWDEKYGFGATWEVDGTPGGRGGDVGGFVVFGIAKLWEYTKKEEWRKAAFRGLDFYFKRDIDRYMCGGGAIDCQSVDKESVYPFFETALLLYELTRDPKCLERAEKAAMYFSSWIYCFNALYPPEAEFSQIGYKTCGGTVVGVEHQCLDPYGGVVVAPLMKLGKWTGNEIWTQAGKAIWLNAIQAVSTPEKRYWHGMERPVGAQNEAFCQTRWTKYRTDPNQRGNFNDFLGVWMMDFKMASLLELEKYNLEP